ncbi:MAG: hypothetical protein ACP5OO_05520 [Chloroflexia bacterium]
MRRWSRRMTVGLFFLLLACTMGSGSVPFYELVADPTRYSGQEVTVLGFYYQKEGEQLLVIGIRTDDGFQNPAPLGQAIWVEGMPPEVLERLNMASGAVYGMVEVTGQFEAGAFGPEGQYPARLLIRDPRRVVALEAAQMREDWVPADLSIPDTLRLADLLQNPEAYRGQVVSVAAFYYATPKPSPEEIRQKGYTSVLAEGIRSLDGIHNAVPIGKQIWVEGMPPDVPPRLHQAESGIVHGLVRATGIFQIGKYGPNGAYPYRLNVRQAEPLGAVPR